MVECAECGGACCKKGWSIVFPETEGVPRRYTTTGHRTIGGTVPGERMMKKGNDGACICLVDGKCRIYQKRPSVCREFEMGSEECLAVQPGIKNQAC